MGGKLAEFLFGIGNTCWDIPLGELDAHQPVTCCLRPGYAFIAIAALPMGLSIGWTLYFAWDNDTLRRLISNDSSAVDMATLVALLFFTMAFGGSAAMGILGMLTTFRLTLSRTQIQFAATFRNRTRNEWTEPLSQYQGVSFCVYRASAGGPTYWTAKPTILHADPAKNVLLRDIRDPDLDGGEQRVREICQAYARGLSLPAIEKPVRKWETWPHAGESGHARG